MIAPLHTVSLELAMHLLVQRFVLGRDHAALGPAGNVVRLPAVREADSKRGERELRQVQRAPRAGSPKRNLLRESRT